MFIDITDTYARTITNSAGKTEILVYRLAGNETHKNIELYSAINKKNVLEVSLYFNNKYWFFHLITPNRLNKGTNCELLLDDGSIINITFTSASLKYYNRWQILSIINDSDLKKLTSVYVKQIKLRNSLKPYEELFLWAEEFNGQYNTPYEGAELLRIVSSKLLVEFEKCQDAQKLTYPNTSMHFEFKKDAPILTRDYNLNTKYGRKMARRQADYNYHYGTQEYRDDIDKMTSTFWTIIFVIIVVIFISIYVISGPQAAIKWLK